MNNTPTDPLRDRHAPLSRVLRLALVVVGAFAALAVAVPGRIGQLFGAAALITIIGVPLGRVVWFGARWTRRRDTRFALVALGVLGAVVLGVVLA